MATWAQGAAKTEVRVKTEYKPKPVRNRNERGATLVEFATLLPVLLLLITGITSFGMTLNNYLMLTNAVNMSAHQLSLSRGQTSPDPCYAAYTTFQAASPLLTPANVGYTIYLNGVAFPKTTVSVASGCGSAAVTADMLQGASAEVIATYPCSLAIYRLSLSCTVTAQTTEPIQ